MYLHYVFDLWVHQWRGRHARGEVIVVRFADDAVVGFEHRDDGERFLSDLRERFAAFGLGLHDEKTRLIEFGRYAARNRKARGLSKPEPFDFLGFTHACGKTKKTGWFALKRVTSKERLPAKLGEVKTELLRRRHDPIPEQGQWLASVVRGHCAYYAVPGNIDAVAAFRKQATRHWYRALRRRSQRMSLTWERGEDYAHQQPSLTAKKLRLLEVRAGAPTLKGRRTGTFATRQAMREGERRLAQQAEASYARMVSDWQAAAPASAKVGASVTPGRASQKPSKGKVARQTTGP